MGIEVSVDVFEDNKKPCIVHSMRGFFYAFNVVEVLNFDDVFLQFTEGDYFFIGGGNNAIGLLKFIFKMRNLCGYVHKKLLLPVVNS